MSGGLPPESKTARNERRKALATTLNALSVAVVVSIVLQALLGNSIQPATIVLGIAMFVALQGALHAILRSLED